MNYELTESLDIVQNIRYCVTFSDLIYTTILIQVKKKKEIKNKKDVVKLAIKSIVQAPLFL